MAILLNIDVKLMEMNFILTLNFNRSSLKLSCYIITIFEEGTNGRT